jgi:uracil-DNA glycosylase
MSRELADHLQYFAEIGVTGMSRDPKWRDRPDGPPEGGPHSSDGTHTEGSVAAPVGAGDSPVGSGFSRTESPESLDDIKADIGPACTRCKLCTLGRSQIVFGVGNPKARLMIVGEAPGEEEDKRGEPFVGRAGQLLTKIIEAIGLTREQVYIANVIKCRPPANRNPEPDEVASCEPFLFRQIDAIQPRVIVPLGKFAAQCLLKTVDPITKLRGRQFDYRGTVLIPTFHPAYLLRNPSAKREVWEDMKKVRAILQSEA